MKTNGFLLKYLYGKSEIGTNGNQPTKDLTATTWQELKDKRDASKLTPGALYRITDYNCTTTQENTKSAGHQFDIILLALSESKLAEEGWAMMHDSPIYDVIFTDDNIKCYLNKRDENVYDVVSVETLLGIEIPVDILEPLINEESKTIDITTLGYGTIDLYEGLTYNYFQNSNLAAWKVWYCLDNDKSRFAWADDTGNKSIIVNNRYEHPAYYVDSVIVKGVGTFYAWVDDEENQYLTANEIPVINEQVFTYSNGERTELGNVTAYIENPNGRGVIYRLIDEFNNDVAYDFKNIQYQLRLDNNIYIDGSTGEYTWVYTFDALNLDTNERTDATLIDRTILIDDGYNKISNNFIGAFENYNIVTKLPYICFLLSWNSDDTYFGVYGNIFNNSHNCYFSNELNNVLLIGCYFGAESRLITQSSSFYINNKKVLTES